MHRPLAPNELIGRDRERDEIDAFVSAVPDGLNALLITGDPGIGKTALWRHCLERCKQAGYDVLVARPSEDEMSNSGLGLLDIFDRVEVDRSRFLSEVDPLRRAMAALDALGTLADRGPTVIAIDDVQWLDATSAKALRYALRRIEDAPVGVVATWRAERPVEDRLSLSTTLPPGKSHTLDLGPLDIGETRRLVGRVVESISPRTLRRIHRISGGNPLFAIELVRSLVEGNRASGLNDGFRLPGSLRGAIEHHLEQVPEPLMRMLEVIAANGPTGYSQLRSYLPDHDLDGLLSQAGSLGVLVVEEDLRVRFAHPLMGSAVYERVNPLARRTLHASLAEQSIDPAVRIRHRALSTDEPDGELSALLEAEANRARGAGALDSAAELAFHSHRLTPFDDTDAVRRRALAQIGDLTAAGETFKALELLDSLVATLPSGSLRADALIQRFFLENKDVDRSEASLSRALEDCGDDELQRGRVLDILGWHRGIFCGDLRAGIRAAEEARGIAAAAGHEELWMQSASHLAHMQALAGNPQPTVMVRTVEIVERTSATILGGGPHAWMGKQILWAGDIAGARDLFTAALDGYAVIGNETERSYRHYDLALVECASGDFEAARTHVELGIQAARDCENLDAEGWMQYPLALVEAWAGRADLAREAASRLLRWPGGPGRSLGTNRARSVLGILPISEGNHPTASDVLVEAVALAEEVGLAHPGADPVLADAVIALACSGRRAEAHEHLRMLRDQVSNLDLERTWAMLDHAGGSVLLADGQLDQAVGHLSSAVSRFDAMGLRPDAARACFALGRALLRAGQRTAAAERLEESITRFASMGAANWEGSAAVDLERASPGRTTGTLTAAESRIAGLVAEGGKNREIGAALFMSVATVEAHLTRMYRKLQIRSRAELARLVASGSLVLDVP